MTGVRRKSISTSTVFLTSVGYFIPVLARNDLMFIDRSSLADIQANCKRIIYHNFGNEYTSLPKL